MKSKLNICGFIQLLICILPLAEGKDACCMVASHNADPRNTFLRSVFWTKLIKSSSCHHCRYQCDIEATSSIKDLVVSYYSYDGNTGYSHKVKVKFEREYDLLPLELDLCRTCKSVAPHLHIPESMDLMMVVMMLMMSYIFQRARTCKCYDGFLLKNCCVFNER